MTLAFLIRLEKTRRGNPRRVSGSIKGVGGGIKGFR
jgi:hypothetical protein